MTVVVQRADEDKIRRIPFIKTVYMNGGILEMVDKNNVYRGGINPDKCIIFRIEDGDDV